MKECGTEEGCIDGSKEREKKISVCLRILVETLLEKVKLFKHPTVACCLSDINSGLRVMRFELDINGNPNHKLGTSVNGVYILHHGPVSTN